MLEIESHLAEQLEQIEVVFQENSDVSDFALKAGYRFPILQLSKTVLASRDISHFHLVIGIESQIPTLLFSFSDATNRFRETDYIAVNSLVHCWLGHSCLEDVKPINLGFRIVKVAADGYETMVNAVLDLPHEPFTICNGTLEDILKDFADKTGIGVVCNYDDLLATEIQYNWVNVQPIEFIRSLTAYLNIKDWYINGQYQLTLLDAQTAIDNYEVKTCKTNLHTGEPLLVEEYVIFSNQLGLTTQFKFADYDNVFDDKDNSIPAIKPVEYDKSVELDIATIPVIETRFADFHEIKDDDNLRIEVQMCPYANAGTVLDIQCFTSNAKAKRVTEEDYDANVQLPTDQLLIEDISGLYMIINTIYDYGSYIGDFSEKIRFARPSEEQNTETVAEE